jgi:hypothetical protein
MKHFKAGASYKRLGTSGLDSLLVLVEFCFTLFCFSVFY